MVPHIQRLGVHIPKYRLSGSAAAEFWGLKGRSGSRAVANWDEDVVTMAVEAAQRCLAGERPDIGTVIVASTTHPYDEKQSAALVAEALNLPEDVDTIDIGTSLRAGTQALRLAADRLVADDRPVLVVAADTRPAPPESAEETTAGDAAVAVLLAEDGPVRLQPIMTRYETWMAQWRIAGERYARSGDSRFVAGLTERALRHALEDAWKAAAAAGGAPARAAIATAVPSAGARAAATVGFTDDGTVHGPDVQRSLGFAGTAAPFVSLAAALEAAQDGDAIAWAAIGDGVDAALVLVDDASALRDALATGSRHPRTLSYGRYLRIREVVADPPLMPFSSEIAQWRDVEHTARLYGDRCQQCGTITYPPQPVCPRCHAHDAMERVPLARSGTLLTFTVEHLFPNPERRLAMGVAELADGVRFYGAIADIPPEELRVGMPVRLVYRRVHRGGGFINYFWKITHAEEAQP